LDFTNFQFDISRLHKDKGKFSKNSKIKKLVSGLSSKDLDFDNLEEFEVDGKMLLPNKRP
jgi:hypothetical protein